MRPSERRVVSSCLAKAKWSGFIPLWLAFVGLTSSFFLKGRYMKNFGFFPQRIWILKKKFRMTVCTIVTDNLESQRVKGVNCECVVYAIVLLKTI